MVFKSLNDSAPIYMTQMFQRLSDTSVKADLHCNHFGRRPKRFVARALNFTVTLGCFGHFER